MLESIQFEKNQHIGIIRFNRPEKFNAMNTPMAKGLQTALDECRKDPAIRAVYLTGNGKSFCAGQDLSELAGEDAPAINVILSEYYNPIILRIRQLEKPVVCGVNGVAAGAGANIAIACDIVLAASSAQFIQAFSKIGLIPDSGGTFFLPRIIGMQRAMALMMLGDKLTASQALDFGMIYKVYPDENFQSSCLALVNQLALMPTKALGYTKAAVNASFDHTLQQQLELEDQLQTTAAGTSDFKEGVDAFLSRRIPKFKGE